jgi:RNA polymerase sigma-70 factor (ECF subfamily)
VERVLMASEEDVWVSQAKAGDQAAFEQLVFRYERQIYSFIYRMMGDADDAYDLTQDCFVRAYRNIGSTSSDLNVSAWLHRIASNACLDVLRRRKRIRWLPWDNTKHEHLLEDSGMDDPERTTVAHETSSAVQETLNRMTPRNRAALIMREYEGMSCEEIGEVLGLSRSAVKSVLFRGREEFRRLYAQQDEGV